MNYLKPENKEEFFMFLNKFPNNGDFYFRGHANAEWSITPSLGRNRDKAIKERISIIEGRLNLKLKKIVTENKLDNLIPKAKGNYHDTWQQLMATQHYGLPTRLIDFSNSKLRALQFAIAALKHLDKDGALIIYENPNSILEDPCNSEILKKPFQQMDKDFFMQVPSYYTGNNNNPLSEVRKLIQGSKFLYRKTSGIFKDLFNSKRHSKQLTKVIIKKELKLPLVEYLTSKNQFEYDIYRGKNPIDCYTSLLKIEYENLNRSNVEKWLVN